jgi:ABC-type sugar transport system ATPase subunit
VQLGDGNPSSAHWQATVEVVQYLGDEQLAYLRLGEAEIVAKLPLEAELKLGREAEFAVPLQKLLLFDAETGNAAGPAA